MLNYLGLDSTEKSVDWGTLAIYSCSQSCNKGPEYKQEFLWKQDIISWNICGSMRFIILVIISSTALGGPWPPQAKCHQQPLSWAVASQFLQPSFLVSSSTLSVHLNFGRPHPHWPPGFVHSIFLGNSFSSIHTTWPAHLSLLDLITLTVFGSF